MSRGNAVRISLIVIMVALALSALLVKEYHVPALGDRGQGNNTLGMSLGLDLSGGIHLVYEADLSLIDENEHEEAIKGAIEIIEKRVNAYGVSEPIVGKQGASRISIQLPGIRDMEAAIDLIGATAQLDFREVLTDDPSDQAAYILENVTLNQEEREKLAESLQAFFAEFRRIDTFGEAVTIPILIFGSQVALETLEQELETLGYPDTTVEPVTRPLYWDPERQQAASDYRLWVPAIATDDSGKDIHLTGSYLMRNTRVYVTEQTQEYEVLFELNDEGAKLFRDITERLKGYPLGIFLDDKLVSWPTVTSVIGKDGRITGVTRDDARKLTTLLNAGALPVPLGHEEGGVFLTGPAVQDEVDPTLGAESINKSLIAGVVGLILVLAFMVFYYRLPGALAGCALIIYGILVLATFKLIPVTLTLAGIAAFILSIGMAVDANVLIFERLKEELRAGRTLSGAVEAGFNRAWTAIRDSNITTFIICAILYWMGSNFAEPRVMGFALTLAIGIAFSMFTAIVITRTFLRLVVNTNIARNLWLFGAQRSEGTPSSEEQE